MYLLYAASFAMDFRFLLLTFVNFMIFCNPRKIKENLELFITVYRLTH